MHRISLQFTGGVTLTISSSTRKAGPFTGNGVTTAFPFTFKVFTTADLYVVLADSSGTETVKTLTTDYTVSLNADQNATPGGTVTMLSAPATGYTLTLTSNVAQTQAVDLQNNGGFYPSVINTALDKLTVLIQQMQTYLTGALKLPVSASGVSATLPVPVANKLLGWNSAATAVTNVDPSTLSSLVAYGSTAIDTFTGTGAQTAFTLTQNPSSQNNLGVFLNGLGLTPGVDFTWNSSTPLVLTLTTAPALADELVVRYQIAMAQGSGTSDSITYTPAGTGAVATTVQAKLRESVSVKDFGAVGDGVTDDTAAIQAAINAGNSFIVPPGTYVISSTLNLTTAAAHGLCISGAGPTSNTGTGTNKTILKPTAAVTTLFWIDGAGISLAIQNWKFKDFTVDMANMTDVSTNYCFRQKAAYGGTYDNIQVINDGSNKCAWRFETGAYTTLLSNCKGAIINASGTSLGDAVTTLTFLNHDFQSAIFNYVVGAAFVGGAAQGTRDKFVLTNVSYMTVTGLDVEGTGVYFNFGASVINVNSWGNYFGGFSGTYSTGTQSGGRGTLLDNGATFEIVNQNLQLDSGTITAKSAAVGPYRHLIQNTNGAGQVTDIQIQNSVAASYIGLDASGNLYVDQSSSTLKNTLQIAQVDKFGVNGATNQLIVNTATTSTASIGANGAPPAQVWGYLSILIGATTYKIPVYNA